MRTTIIERAGLLKEALHNNNAVGIAFCGLLPGDYLAGIAPSFDLRAEQERVRSALAGLRQQIRNADAKTRVLNRRMADGIRSHPDFGPDSALYVQSGYVAHNQRRSGLARPPVETPPIAPLTPPSAQAAA